MYENVLLIVRTARHGYVVRRTQVNELRLISGSASLEQSDQRGKPIIGSELAHLLEGQEHHDAPGRHALVIHMRRQSVALLVQRVDDIVTQSDTQSAAGTQIQPLPGLLAQRLEMPWVTGVLLCDTTPLLVLDLRRIAHDVLQRHKHAG
jgi:chemotaxis signal transduction protein